jgi:hypothetical protein
MAARRRVSENVERVAHREQQQASDSARAHGALAAAQGHLEVAAMSNLQKQLIQSGHKKSLRAI